MHMNCRTFALLASSAIAVPAVFAADALMTADTIYVGGDIVTINDAQPPARRWPSRAAGSSPSEAGDIEDQHRGPDTRIVDLGGRRCCRASSTRIRTTSTRCWSPTRPRSMRRRPGPARTWTASSPRSRPSPTSSKIPKGELIMAYGYDDTVMPGGRLLNRDDLDAAFPDNPVRVDHVSMHGAVMNSLALKKYGYSADTVTPPGRRDRAQGRHQRTLRPDHGERLPARRWNSPSR